MRDGTLLQVQDLSVRYPDGTQGLRDVSFRLRRGECVLVAGPTGSGKSTLAHALMNVIPERIRAEKSGRVLLEGEPLEGLPLSRLASRLQLVLQNPDAALFGTTVLEGIRFGPENLCRPREEIVRTVERLARSFALTPFLRTSPHLISSGEKQRASLASSLAMDPEILILDEPFTYLDREGRRALARDLGEIKKSGCTLLVMEHQFEELSPLVDRVLLMEGGRLGERGDSAEPLAAGRFGVSSFEMPDTAASSPAGEFFLSFQSLRFSYGISPSRGAVFQDLTGVLGPLPAVTPVLGPNGSGKTTLGLLLAGLLKPSGGSFQINPGVSPSAVGFVFQRPEMQLFSRSVEGELRSGLENRGLLRIEVEARVEAMLQRLDLAPRRARHPQNLSRGEKRRLAFGAAMILEPGLLIMDEPTVGQDGGSLERMFALISEAAARGMKFLILTHDERFARRLSGTHLSLAGDGRIELCSAGSSPGVPRAVFRIGGAE